MDSSHLEPTPRPRFPPGRTDHQQRLSRLAASLHEVSTRQGTRMVNIPLQSNASVPFPQHLKVPPPLPPPPSTMPTMVTNENLPSQPQPPPPAAAMRPNAGAAKPPAPAGPPGGPKKPNFFQRTMTKLNLNPLMIMLIFKASLPPVIVLAFYQANAVTEEYTTLGYLSAILALLGTAALPRAKFLQTIILGILFTCVAAAVGLLVLYCAIQARIHTTPPGMPLFGDDAGYNSSASAVVAIWLIFQMWVVGALRDARLQLNLPTIQYSIFSIVVCVYAPLPQVATMPLAESFILKILKSFLTGLAVAVGVNFVIFPITCRKAVFAMMGGFVACTKGVLAAQTAYMASLEVNDPFMITPMQTPKPPAPAPGLKNRLRRKKNKKAAPPPPPAPVSPVAAQVGRLRGAIGALVGLHGKLAGDLPFAKREIAWGKLNATDLQEIFRLFENITLPLVGLTSVIDILERIALIVGWTPPSQQDPEDQELEAAVAREWQDVMKSLHEPFAAVTTAMANGMEHAALVLELKPSPKGKKDDVEIEGELPKPGSRRFTAYLEKKSNDFYADREITLKAWCEERGLSHPAEVPPSDKINEWFGSDGAAAHLPREERLRRQLFMMLHMEYILWTASRHVLALCRYADSKVDDGTMSRSRLILPGWKRVKKWFYKALFTDDNGRSDDNLMRQSANGEQEIRLGSAFGRQLDPEHLPPVNAWESFGDVVRKIPHILGSDHSKFGVRVACACMTVGIVDYLRNTQDFFIHNRLMWSVIMISFSMIRTSGQSLFNYAARIGGTVLAMAASYVVWYIVDGHTAGVIVFLWVWLLVSNWVILTKPRFATVGILMAVTSVLIIGYELQAKKVGIAEAELNEQPYYPLYLLAPYRLATVVGGLAVAYIWTIFPYPTNETSELRRNLGSGLFLLANYYSIVHATMRVYIRGEEGNMNDKNSPAALLLRPRHQLFTKLHMLLAQLKTASTFTSWQPAFGGRFPAKSYDQIIMLTQRILNYAALVSYASRSFGETGEEVTAKISKAGAEASTWRRDFRVLNQSINLTSHENMSLISLMSSAVFDGRPLPPYLQPPEPFQLLRKLEAMDTDILNIKHIAEPGYAAFAVMQIASRSIVHDIGLLVEEVKKLVGEMDFSFEVTSKKRDWRSQRQQRQSVMWTAVYESDTDDSDSDDGPANGRGSSDSSDRTSVSVFEDDDEWEKERKRGDRLDPTHLSPYGNRSTSMRNSVMGSMRDIVMGGRNSAHESRRWSRTSSSMAARTARSGTARSFWID